MVLEPQAALSVDLQGGVNFKFGPDSPAPYHFTTFPLSPSDPEAKIAKGFEIMYDDPRGPTEQHGQFGKETFAKTEGAFRSAQLAIGVDQRWFRHLLLSPKVQQSTPTLASSSPVATVWTQCFNTLIMSSGGTSANLALLKETSPANPVEAYINYSPGAGNYISALAPIRLAFPTTSGPRLLVGRSGVAPQIVSDTVGTVDGTQHANLVDCYGMLFSPLNASTPGTGTNIFLANKGLWSLPVTAAIGDAPVQLLSNLPNGGYAIAQAELLNGSLGLRHYWWLPDTTAGSGGVPQVGNPGRVMTTNLAGGDPQDIPFTLVTVIQAVLWGKMIIATDGTRVEAFDGKDVISLEYTMNRAANSDFRHRVVNFLATDDSLGVLSMVTDGNIATTVFSLDMYNQQFNSWASCSELLPTSGGTFVGTDYPASFGLALTMAVRCQPSMPWSKTNAFAHYQLVPAGATSIWNRIFMSPADMNPFYNFRQTGASQNNAQPFAASGFWRSAFATLSGAEGRPKKIEQVVFLGQVPAGTKVGVQLVQPSGVLGSEYIFSPGFDNLSQPTYTGDDTLYDEIAAQVNLYQTSGSNSTPNGFPVILRGRFYMTDQGSTDLGLPGGGF